MSYNDWTSDRWRAEATSWLDTCLTRIGRTRTGAVEQPRTRPWGTVLHAPTDSGLVWLKAPAASLRFELPLVRALGGLGLDGAPTVLAVDEPRGLLLLADAGTSFRERWPVDTDLAAHVVEAWPVVARLQRAATSLVPELLAAGVADLRPAAMPGRFDETVARARAAYGASDAPLLDRLAALRPRFVEMCSELAASRIAPSVDHNDVHQGNLAVGDDGRLTVLDWGDAVIAHPFAALLFAERTLADLLGGTPDHPRVVAGREAYLATFAADAADEDLVRTARLAVTVGQIGRAWVWQRALDTFADAPAFVRPPGWPPEFERGPLQHLELAEKALAAA